ncbi:MAG: photosystem II cytochrome c-550 [Crocosphaera sp.]|nr:photosystem II cytochrome c-550 [Crocosphaera sp.]
MKRFILMAIAAIFFFLQFPIHNASAIESDEATRTIPLNEAGETVILTDKQVERGKQLFDANCVKCHKQGKTFTNNNVTLGLKDLAGAEPRRDNLLALIDYLKYPTSYDGEDDYSELHPNVIRTDIYQELRNLTEDDVYDMSGYLLVAPKLDEKWGGGIYY